MTPRLGEKIDVFGEKLPQDAVASWGITILLAITGYFWPVFRDFGNRVMPSDLAWNVPWIGIWTEIVSRVGFGLTLLIPPCTVVYLAWHRIRSEEGLAVHLLYGSAAFVVGALTIGTILARLEAMRRRS
jgi:hypothetical protein